MPENERNENELRTVSIRLVEEPPLYSEMPIHTPKEAVEVVGKEIQSYDREVICVLNMSAKGRIICMNLASMGTLTTALAVPREIFKSAVLSNAASMIMFHNHPSGDPVPSKEDITMTFRMIESGKLLGIEVLDHIIVGKGHDYFSFKENGLCYDQMKDKSDRLVENKGNDCHEKTEADFRPEKGQDLRVKRCRSR